MTHVGSRVSVQQSEPCGEVKQARRYRRNGVVLKVPAVYRGGWQKHATAAASGGDEEGISCTQGSAAAHTFGIAAKCTDKSIRARREERQCIWGIKGDVVAEGGGVTAVAVQVGGDGPCWVEGVRTGG